MSVPGPATTKVAREATKERPRENFIAETKGKGKKDGRKSKR